MLDVEQAFLYGILDREIYMQIPEGMHIGKGKCLRLKKSIYGLVQSSRTWWATFSKFLKKLGFKISKADNCLFIRQTKKGICVFVLYVDDCFITGDKIAIDETIKEIKTKFNITTSGSLDDFLGYKVKMNREQKTTYITQPFLIEKMIEKFGQDMPKRTYRCPGTPGFIAKLKSIRDEHVLNESKMTMYRSGVGMLLYLQKHSRPDISNATRELSKCLTKATMLHYKELLRVMKFVVQTKDLGLRLKVESTSKLLKEPEVNNPKMIHWYLVAFPDASFASDKDNRHSITVFVIYFCCAPISWK